MYRTDGCNETTTMDPGGSGLRADMKGWSIHPPAREPIRKMSDDVTRSARPAGVPQPRTGIGPRVEAFVPPWQPFQGRTRHRSQPSTTALPALRAAYCSAIQA